MIPTNSFAEAVEEGLKEYHANLEAETIGAVFVTEKRAEGFTPMSS